MRIQINQQPHKNPKNIKPVTGKVDGVFGSKSVFEGQMILIISYAMLTYSVSPG